MKAAAALVPLSLVTACTTMGPMPATTMVSAVPLERPGFEVQAGGVPGYYLSDSTHNPRGTVHGQLGGLVDTGASGVIVGARQAGEEGDAILEPFVGIRRKLDDTFALAALVFGTHAEHASGRADYAATRAGGELAADATVFPGEYASLHAQAALDATALWARGHYCVDGVGEAIDCDNDGKDTVVEAHASGVYVAGSLGLSLDLLRAQHAAVRLIRFGMTITAGAMPRIRDGRQEVGDPYVSGGASLTLAFGE